MNPFLLPRHLVLHLFLVPIPGLQQLLSLLIGYIRQFLGPGLLKNEPLDPIFKRIGLLLAVLEKIPGLQHLEAFF